MTDNIATDGSRDLFASHREPAWHRLGVVFDHEVTDSPQMLELAGLSGWNVREEPLMLPGVEFVKDHKVILADIGAATKALGVTGERYKIVQNEEAFAFLQSLHDGAVWETAGAIKGGRVVFGSMAFERDFVLDPNGVEDKISTYLLVHTSHDGSTGVSGGVTPVRVVCQNTLNAALGDIKQTFNIRHTQNAEQRMTAEAEMWRHAHSYMDAFEIEAKALFETPVSSKQYFDAVGTMFPRPDKDVKGAIKKWDNRMDTFAQAWNGKPNAGITGTAWGVFNAMLEANQWGRKAQNTDTGAENFAAAGAGFDTVTNTFRTNALALAKSL